MLLLWAEFCPHFLQNWKTLKSNTWTQNSKFGYNCNVWLYFQFSQGFLFINQIGNMNLKSSASKSGFLDPNSASGDKSCFVRTISFSGSRGNLEFFIVSFSSKSPLSELAFGLKVILCHSDLLCILKILFHLISIK